VLREWTERKAREWIAERVPPEDDPTLSLTTLRAAAAYWLLHHAHEDYGLRRIMLDFVDLRRVRLAGRDLTEANLHSSDLRGVDLRGAILRHALLISCDFSGANLAGADLTGADCRGASFESANLTDVTWRGAVGARLRPV
jgi:uncharacterized protein YjbI with pentapeptide repeats